MSRFPSRCPGGLGGLGLGLGLGLALASAVPVTAAPSAAQGDQAKVPDAASALFVSPFGEPFRASHGLADWFAGADGDHNGVLTLKEFTADGLRFLTVLDTDKDGRVDGFENTAYENDVAPEILPQSAAFRPGREEDDRAGAPAPRARGLEGASTFGLLDEPQPVRGADLNYDGKITAAEQAKAAARRFAILDTETTGQIALPPLQSRMAIRQAPPTSFGRFFRRRPD
jgi:hypothetical protein